MDNTVKRNGRLLSGLLAICVASSILGLCFIAGEAEAQVEAVKQGPGQRARVWAIIPGCLIYQVDLRNDYKAYLLRCGEEIKEIGRQ